MDLVDVLHALLLIMLANGAPILAAWLLNHRCAYPIDGGCFFRDGRRWFGPSKTWRGLIAALIATSLLSLLLGLGWIAGALAAAAAMAGDLLTSFIKRRLGVAPSDMAAALDKIPEGVLPALALMVWMPLSLAEAAVAALLFVLLDVPLSVVLYRWGIRKRPY